MTDSSAAPGTGIRTEHEAVAAFAHPNLIPHMAAAGASPYLIHRRDQLLVSVEHTLASPVRTRHHLLTHDMASFTRAVSDHADPVLSRIYADQSSMSLCCVIDHYARGQPAWGEHKISYQMKLSSDWTTWIGSNKKKFRQGEFADWLEDNALCIVDPKPAAIIELARNLEIRQTGVFKQATRIQDGTVDLQFTVNNEVQGIKIPEVLRVEIPVCVGDETSVALQARFRYRFSDGAVSFFYDLYRVEDALDAYWRDACAKAAADSGVQILQGSFTALR